MSDLNKAQRLALAGAIAPALRAQSERAKRRIIARTDAAGNVVGYSTLAEIQEALLARQRVELDVDDGTRPETDISVSCRHCSAVFRQSPKGRTQLVCPLGCPCLTPGCEGTVSRVRAKRHAKCGTRAMCLSCWDRWVNSVEYREAASRKKRADWLAMSAEQRDAITQKKRSCWTPERRAEARVKSLDILKGSKGSMGV